MLEFSIDRKKCRRCSLCMEDCPVSIIEKDSEGFPFITEEKEKLCLKCQHCLAICPDAALSILGKNPDESMPASDMPTAKQVEVLIRNRRSIRHFKKNDVEFETIRSLLCVTANCPTGENMRALTFTIIDNREDMEKFVAKAYGLLEKRIEEGTLPERFRFYAALLRRYKSGRDIIFRGAPHLIVASAPKGEGTPEADCFIALSYFDLYAYSLKVGTVWLGFLAFMFEFMPEIKDVLGIPADHEAPYALLFGKAKYKYPRGVQRDDFRINRPEF
ncbi:nitroreductase family protein [Geovibrio sp. ADMFC3]